jgi:hypothetical protein
VKYAERFFVFVTSAGLFACGVMAGLCGAAGSGIGVAVWTAGAVTFLVTLNSFVRTVNTWEAEWREMIQNHEQRFAELRAEYAAAVAKLSQPAEGDEWKAGGP